ncbi:Spag6 [Symbiodinium sp. CCMP2456]|nr:Spag6 [Symbiodinium sp. CCMP2456]
MSHAPRGRAVLQVFEEYQKARVTFVQTVADLATRPQNIDALQNAGVMALLRPLLLDNVASIQQSAALALGRLANYSDELAESVVTHEILPQLVYSLAQQNRFYKKAAAFVLRAVSKHSPQLAQAVVDSGALEALVNCLEEFDPSVKEAAAWALGYIARHTKELAQTVVDAGDRSPDKNLMAMDSESLRGIKAEPGTSNGPFPLPGAMVDLDLSEEELKAACTRLRLVGDRWRWAALSPTVAGQLPAQFDLRSASKYSFLCGDFPRSVGVTASGTTRPAVVTIAADWDGSYNGDDFLRLQAGEQVRITDVSSGGAFLYGSVVTARGPSRSGWFGGPGCEAVMAVSIPVPLGKGSEEDLPLEGPGGKAVGFGFNGAPGSLQEEVEAYVERNCVDIPAATRLRELPPELQAELIKTDMTKSIRNPSAALLSRINHLVKEAQFTEPPPQVVSRAEVPQITIRGSAGLRGPHERSRSPRRMQRSGGAIPASRFSAPRMGEAIPYMPHGGVSSDEVESFIARHGLDHSAADRLRALSPEEQENIVLTDLTNARNPSAVVLSRIDRVHKEEGHRQQVEEYLHRHNIDEEASAMLRALPVDRQQVIIGSDMTNANNSSAVLISRIRGIEAMHVPAGQPPPPSAGWRPSAGRGPPRAAAGAPLPSPAEDFIRRWDLDDSVAAQLRALPIAQLNEVMTCNVAQARNPSAMVKSRIRSVTARPPAPEFSVHQDTVEEYLSRYKVDEAAQAEMRAAAPEVQLRVMEQELSNCRNPSAVLSSRIREISRGSR